MAGNSFNRFPAPRKSPTGTILKIYAVTLIVALVVFLLGYHRTSYALQIGVWLVLVAWLKLRGRQ